MTTLTEPAEAIAVARCIAARTLAAANPRRLPPASHTRRCAWCDFPLEWLVELVDAFNVWSGYSIRSNTYAHHELRAWADLTRAEQERRIVAAQGFEAGEGGSIPSDDPIDEDRVAAIFPVGQVQTSGPAASEPATSDPVEDVSWL